METVIWPQWAIRLLIGLSSTVFIAMILQWRVSYSSESTHSISSSESTDDKSSHHSSKKRPWAFRILQAQYLSVYLIIMLADWLQGTNMYTLYEAYGVNIGALFLTGFLTAAIVGPFLGPFVDKAGRKCACIVFCVLEVIINLMEHVPSFPTLMAGRVLGGISTCLLFTAFEAWMVGAHRAAGYPEAWLGETFSWGSAGSGAMAILAGFIAQVAADKVGDIGPFQVAILLTVVALVLILPWRENRASDRNNDDEEVEEVSSTSLLQDTIDGLKTAWNQPAILRTGLAQACFEGAMYTFVFMWVPALLYKYSSSVESSDSSMPVGLVFSCFMLCMTLGATLAGTFLALLESNNATAAASIIEDSPLPKPDAAGTGSNAGSTPTSKNTEVWRIDTSCTVVYALGAATMAIPAFFGGGFWTTLACFCAFEGIVGAVGPFAALLRVAVFPAETMSTTTAAMRLPLNALVVLGTTVANRGTAAMKTDSIIASDAAVCGVFRVVFIMLLAATLLQASSPKLPSSTTFEKTSGKEKVN